VIKAARIRAAGIVVPAHNEETLLATCLAALREAGRAVTQVPVYLVAVADTCTDQTAATARACGARVISIHARRVGAARAAGMRELLRLTAGLDPAEVWLATTDADSVVPPGWLRRQLDYADQGWDLVLGTVAVADWDGHPPQVPAAFAARYHEVRGDAYLAKKDVPGAINEYQAALMAAEINGTNGALLELKLQDLGASAASVAKAISLATPNKAKP